jgi:hypothetical protein
MNFNGVHSAGPDPAPGYSPQGMTACHTRWQDSRVVLDLAARSSGENDPRAGRGHARWARLRRGHRARDGAVAHSPVARCHRQAPVGSRCGTGQGGGAGAHQKGGSTMRRCKRHQAAAFNGGGVAPVVIDKCGEVMQLEWDKG